MTNHVIKFEYEDGKKLTNPVLWCGETRPANKWNFVDAQHVALAAGGSIQPCKKCIKAIIQELEKGL